MSDAVKRPFVRVYHDLMREYPSIYGDDAALAAWLRLLVILDKMWPATPEVPRSVRPRHLAKLTQAGLVTLVPPHGYQIRGYEKDRLARQEAARNAAAVRWHSKGNADASANAMLVPVPVPDISKEKNGLRRARTNLEKVGEIVPRVLR